MEKNLGLQKITPITKGIKINNIPYLVPRAQEIVLLAKKPKKNLKVDKSAKKLYFLLTALDFSSKPFLRALIHRSDGVIIKLEWKGDGKGGITTVGNKDLATKLGWEGKIKFYVKGKMTHTKGNAFVTSWVNDNQWLPIKNIEFELLDPKAKADIISITARNLGK